MKNSFIIRASALWGLLAVLLLGAAAFLPSACSTTGVKINTPRTEIVFPNGAALFDGRYFAAQATAPWSVRLRDASGFAFLDITGPAGALVTFDIKEKKGNHYNLAEEPDPQLQDWETKPVADLHALLEQEHPDGDTGSGPP